MGCLRQIIRFAFYLHLCGDGLHFEVELHTIDKDYLVLSLGVVIFISKYYILTSSLISMKLNKLNCLDKPCQITVIAVSVINGASFSLPFIKLFDQPRMVDISKYGNTIVVYCLYLYSIL